MYIFIERDLAALGDQDATLDPDLLLRNRRTLSQRIAQLASLIEADDHLAEQPDLAAEMIWLFDEMRASLARHQKKWPPELAASDVAGFRASAADVQQCSAEFKLWCDTRLGELVSTKS